MTDTPTTANPEGSQSTTRFLFRSNQKLRVAAEFERARKGRRFGDSLFGLQYVVNDLGHARLGMAVGLKAAGNGVRRNRVRRLIRESFRLNQHELPAVDVFVTARNDVRAAPTPAINESLERLWRKIRQS